MTIKVIAPTPLALGVTVIRQNSGATYNIKNGLGYNQANLFLSASYAMGCCGANTMSNLSGLFDSEKELQNYVAACIFPFWGYGATTTYGIASSDQIRTYKDRPLALLNVLFDLGLKEVFKSPNRNHGPNDMHLLVFDPKTFNRNNLEKYLYQDKLSGIWLPLWVKSLDEPALEALMTTWSAVNASRAETEKQQLEKEKNALWVNNITTFENTLYYLKQSQLSRQPYAIPQPLVERALRFLKVYGWNYGN